MEMTHDNQLAAIDAGIKKLGITQHALEKLAGVAIGTIKDLRRGRTEILRADKWQKISKVLDGDKSVSMVPVLGYVGAGETVTPLDDLPLTNGMAEHDYEQLNCEFVDEAPSGIYRDMVALRVKGDSMEPWVWDGDTIYYNQIIRGNFNDYLNKRVVVRLKDGRVFIKILRQGFNYGKYNLQSLNTPKIIESVELDWCARVAFTKPA